MKKLTIIVAVIILAAGLIVTSGCGKKGFKGDKVTSLIPVEAKGILLINFQQFSQTKLYDEMIKKAATPPAQDAEAGKKFFKDFEDFTQSTGIDPKKDLVSVAVGILGFDMKKEEKDNANIVAVINLKYDRNKVASLLKEKGIGSVEEYSGASFYAKTGEKGVFALINDSLIAIADNTDVIKKVVDLAGGKGASIIDNPILKKYIANFNAENLVSFAMEFPAESKKASASPFGKFDLTKAEAVNGYATYKSNTWSLELNLINPTKENVQTAVTLNGLKGLAGMAGPEAAEVAQQINITGTDEKLTLSLNITDALMEKLEKALKAKASAMTPPSPDAESAQPDQAASEAQESTETDSSQSESEVR